MKVKEIQELIDFIAKSGLEEVKVETEDFKISVKRSNVVVKGNAFTDQAIQNYMPLPSLTLPVNANTNLNESGAMATSPELKNNEPAQTTPEEKNYVAIRSPMIGTFYRSPNPDSPSFVNVEDAVKVGQVVCIIEAMKLFNEIESEVSGKIVKVLVDNASPVEYDQPLFLVDPS